MKKRILALALALLLFGSTAGCSAPSENRVKLKNLKFVEENAQTEEKTLSKRDASFRIWTTSLQTAADVSAKLDQIEGKNYQTVSLYLLWSDFEYEQGKYAFSFIDEVISLILARGYKIDLTLVLWTYNLSWKDALDFQTDQTGENYRYDEIRSETISVFSQKNISCIKNSIFALADHCDKTFGENIIQWSAVFSPTGKAELPAQAGIDCSASAREAFYSYLQDKYSDISAFNSRTAQTFESWDALRQSDFAALAGAAAFDYEIFTTESLSAFLKSAATAFRSVSPGTPVVLKISDPSGVFAANYSGLSDLFSLTRDTGISAVSFVAAENSAQTAFLCDMIAGETGLPVMAELDSAVLTPEAEAENLAILSGRAVTAETANFDGDSPDPAIFALTGRQNSRQNEIILVNSLNFIKQPPAEGLYRKLRAAYTSMTQSGEGTATVLSDLQIIENPNLLSGIEEIHLGALSETVYLYPALAEILAGYEGRITDNDNAQPTFLDQYANPISEEYSAKINAKLKE